MTFEEDFRKDFPSLNASLRTDNLDLDKEEIRDERPMILILKETLNKYCLDKSKVREAREKLIVYLDYKDTLGLHFESMIYRDIKQKLLDFEKELGLTSEELKND